MKPNVPQPNVPQPNVPQPYIPQLSVTLALAIMQAYEDYKKWDEQGDSCDFPYTIKLPGFQFLERITQTQPDDTCTVPFGFTATGGSGDIFPEPINLLAFRGTRTTYEGISDLEWTPTQCVLPSSDGAPYGKAASGLYNFYIGYYDSNGDQLNSLEQPILQAVGDFTNKNLPLVIAGHSLGGAVATLAALEIVAGGHYKGNVSLYTYGSLHVGDSTFASFFGSGSGGYNIPAYRVANLADWVPSFLGGLPTGEDASGYEHVGLPCTFLWQTDGDWHNHSMEDIYLNTVQNYSQVIQFGQRTYPQSCSG
jgi:hypothetical protein